jgi:hypothetical protein
MRFAQLEALEAFPESKFRSEYDQQRDLELGMSLAYIAASIVRYNGSCPCDSRADVMLMKL